MGEERYAWYTKKDEEEFNRLRIQESFVDPPTIRHLEIIGVSEGWKCLEVGAGAGSIAKWLLSRVGSTGKVVATDIDAIFLRRIGFPNLDPRRHDILTDDLEKGLYDLVHCRKVLHQLSEPDKAVKKMVDAIRPGGRILLEEDDWGSKLSVDVTDASAAAFTGVLRVYLDILRQKRVIDFYLGRRVRGIVEQLGFTDIGQDGWTCMMRGGELYLRSSGELWPTVGNSVLHPAENSVLHPKGDSHRGAV